MPNKNNVTYSQSDNNTACTSKPIVISLDDDDFMEAPVYLKTLTEKTNIKPPNFFHPHSKLTEKAGNSNRVSVKKKASQPLFKPQKNIKTEAVKPENLEVFWSPVNKDKVATVDLSGDIIDDQALVNCPKCGLELKKFTSTNLREAHVSQCLNSDNTSFNLNNLNSTDGYSKSTASPLRTLSSESSLVGSNINSTLKKESINTFKSIDPKELDFKNTTSSLKIEEEELQILLSDLSEGECENLIQQAPGLTSGNTLSSFPGFFSFPKKNSSTPSTEEPKKSTPEIKKVSSLLPNHEELLRRGSFVSNPSDPIIITCPDLYHQAKSKLLRELPVGKKVPGTCFTVDAFNLGPVPGCKAYFLSHYHSDHYGGLGKTFAHGTIFASPITARLVRSQIGVHPDYIQTLELNTLYEVNGTRVILIDANHCPGAVLFLYEVPILNSSNNEKKYTRILHTGDFRVEKTIHLDPSSLIMSQPIDHLYLDTTYCNPNYAFPTQGQVVEAITKTAVKIFNETPLTSNFSSTLHRWGFGWIAGKSANDKSRYDKVFVCGTYSIGKERIFVSIAQALNSKIYVTARKRRLLSSFQDPELDAILTGDPTQAAVHVQPMGTINAKKLKDYYDLLKKDNPNLISVIGVRPTGWTFSNRFAKPENVVPIESPSDLPLDFQPSYKSQNVSIFGVPYSEHSSFKELKEFVGSLAKCHDKTTSSMKVIPTVRTANLDYNQMNHWIQGWMK